MTPRGIAIVGLNGSGKSTLGHLLAKKTGYFEMDVEDYYFPEQRGSRRNALEGISDNSSPNAVPFSAPRDKEQVGKALREDIRLHPEFILCGVSLNWGDDTLSSIGAVFRLMTPSDLRVDRINTVRKPDGANGSPRVAICTRVSSDSAKWRRVCPRRK